MKTKPSLHHRFTSAVLLAVCGWLLAVNTVVETQAQAPQLINYQGRIQVGALDFNGPGLFKFALVNSDGSTTYWSNDGSSTSGGQPAAAVSLTVVKGIYSVQLGDTSLANMTALPATVFANPDVRLRVWFNDGVNNFQQLAPDQRITAVGYAMVAGSIPDGVITESKLAPGAITAGKIAAGAIGGALIAPGSITPDKFSITNGFIVTPSGDVYANSFITNAYAPQPTVTMEVDYGALGVSSVAFDNEPVELLSSVSQSISVSVFPDSNDFKMQLGTGGNLEDIKLRRLFGNSSAWSSWFFKVRNGVLDGQAARSNMKFIYTVGENQKSISLTNCLPYSYGVAAGKNGVLYETLIVARQKEDAK